MKNIKIIRHTLAITLIIGCGGCLPDKALLQEKEALLQQVKELESGIAKNKELAARQTTLREQLKVLQDNSESLEKQIAPLDKEQQQLDQRLKEKTAQLESHWDRVVLKSGTSIGCRVVNIEGSKLTLESEAGLSKTGDISAIKAITFGDPKATPSIFPEKKTPLNKPRTPVTPAMTANRPFVIKLTVRRPGGGGLTDKSVDYDNKTQKVQYKIEAKSREGVRVLENATLKIVSVGKHVTDRNKYKVLLSEELPLTLKPGEAKNLLTKVVSNEYDNNRTAKFGFKNYGYLCLVYDQNNKLITQKISPRFLERHIEDFETLGEERKIEL